MACNSTWYCSLVIMHPRELRARMSGRMSCRRHPSGVFGDLWGHLIRIVARQHETPDQLRDSGIWDHDRLDAATICGSPSRDWPLSHSQADSADPLPRNFLNSTARCWRWISLITVPSAVPDAANKVVMPCRT